MAIITIRQLTREAKDVFERVEQTREPLLVTRNGTPVAALVPVDAEDAARYAIASAPDMIETRRRAEAAGPRRTTRSVDELAEELGVDLGPRSRAAKAEEAHTSEHVVPAHLIKLFSGAGAHAVEQHATNDLKRITRTVIQSADESPAPAHVSRVQQLNRELFSAALREALADGLGERLLAEDAQSVEQLIDDALAMTAVRRASETVAEVNGWILDLGRRQPSGLTFDAYELSMRTCMAARPGLKTRR